MGFRGAAFVCLTLLLGGSASLILVPHTAATPRACPSPCDCGGLERVSVNCAHQNLTAAPTTTRDVELAVRLDVSDNQIALLPNNTFHHYPDLEEILLSANVIQTVEVGAFHGLVYVQKIDLSENIIEFIHPDTFLDNPNLKTLSLSANPLTKLSGNFPIMNAPSLTALDLSLCELVSLSREMFVGLHNLKTLNIESNNITHFPMEIFEEIETLEELSLGDNHWPCWDCNLVHVLNVLAQRKPENISQHGVICLDVDGSRMMWLVSALESNFCDDDLTLTIIEHDQTIVIDDETVIDASEPRREEVFGGVWFFLRQPTAYRGLVAGGVAALAVFFAALCMCAIRRGIIRRRSSSPLPTAVKNMNLLLAYATRGHKRDSTDPLLTPGSCPPSPGESNSQPPSLFDEYVRTRPASNHCFSVVDL